MGESKMQTKSTKNFSFTHSIHKNIFYAVRDIVKWPIQFGAGQQKPWKYVYPLRPIICFLGIYSLREKDQICSFLYSL